MTDTTAASSGQMTAGGDVAAARTTAPRLSDADKVMPM